MNRAQLEMARRDNANRLVYPDYLRNKDRIVYSCGEGIEHFFAKAICFVLIKNGVPTNLLPSLFRNIGKSWKDLDKLKDIEFVKFKHEWQRPMIICEAPFKNEGEWDLYILDTDERIEIVDKNEKAKNPYDENTIVIRI